MNPTPDQEKSIPALAHHLHSSLGLENALTQQFLEVCLRNAILFDRKQSDYGPRNISSFGAFGVMVRANDKFERLKTLLTKKRKRARNEPILDTYQDIANYATIAYMIEKGVWPT